MSSIILQQHLYKIRKEIITQINLTIKEICSISKKNEVELTQSMLVAHNNETHLIHRVSIEEGCVNCIDEQYREILCFKSISNQNLIDILYNLELILKNIKVERNKNVLTQ